MTTLSGQRHHVSRPFASSHTVPEGNPDLYVAQDVFALVGRFLDSQPCSQQGMDAETKPLSAISSSASSRMISAPFPRVMTQPFLTLPGLRRIDTRIGEREILADGARRRRVHRRFPGLSSTAINVVFASSSKSWAAFFAPAESPAQIASANFR
jgi:hypothetical protein